MPPHKPMLLLAAPRAISLRPLSCLSLVVDLNSNAHAKQFRRLKRTVKRQRMILGVAMREVQRKLDADRQAMLRAVRRPMCQATPRRSATC